MLKKLMLICSWIGLCVSQTASYATNSTQLTPPITTINKFHYFFTSNFWLEKSTHYGYIQAVQLQYRLCPNQYRIKFVANGNATTTPPLPFTGSYKVSLYLAAASQQEEKGFGYYEISIVTLVNPDNVIIMNATTPSATNNTYMYMTGEGKTETVNVSADAALNKNDTISINVCLKHNYATLLLGGFITIESR